MGIHPPSALPLLPELYFRLIFLFLSGSLITWLRGERCEVLLSTRVCVSVCPPCRTSQKPHVQTSRNFLCVLAVAVARSSSDNDATRHALSVLRLTSCFHNSVAYVAYGEAYGRGVSVSGRKHSDGRSFSVSTPPLSALPPAD